MRRFLIGMALLLFSTALAQTVVVATNPNIHSLIIDMAEQYEANNPGVNVEFLETPPSHTDTVALYLQFMEARSSDIDLYYIGINDIGDFAEHFLSLNDTGALEFTAAHFPAIIENNTLNGELYAMPLYTDAGLLYYRTDLLEKYGFDGPPETWTELTEMAQTIQEGERAEGNADFWGFVWQGDAYEGLTCDALEWIASNAGGTIVSPDGVITINNENAIAAVELAASWVGTISPISVTGWGEEESRAVWHAGNAAFMRNWPYAYTLSNNEDSAVRGVFDVSVLPRGEGTPAATLGGWNYAVSRYSENPDIAADLALFLTAPEQQKYIAIEGSFNPTIAALYEDPEVLASNPFFGRLYDVFVNSTARPSTITAPNYQETSRLFFSAIHDVLTGAQDAEIAFAVLEADLEALLNFPVSNDPN